MLLDDLTTLRWFPLAGPAIAVEQRHDKGAQVIRAELPGIDPARDVDVSIRDGMLRLVVVRLPDLGWHAHTQFRYGTFQRLLALPPGAHGPISLSYRRGILQVTVPCDSPQQPV